jgi:hypothetical protein
MERFIVWSLVTMNWLGLASRPANAQAPAGSQRQAIVTLNSLVAELLAKNPELQAVRKRYETALTRPYQDSALPDPRLRAGWRSNGSPLPGAGLGEPTSNIGMQMATNGPRFDSHSARSRPGQGGVVPERLSRPHGFE